MLKINQMDIINELEDMHTRFMQFVDGLNYWYEDEVKAWGEVVEKFHVRFSANGFQLEISPYCDDSIRVILTDENGEELFHDYYLDVNYGLSILDDLFAKMN